MVGARDLEYLVDGYNLLPRLLGKRPAGGPGDLARARQTLLHWLADRAPDPAKVTAVFDFKPDKHTRESQWTGFRGVRVGFASGYTDADALIAELCRRHPHPARLRVVSDDHAVRAVARRCGAGWIACMTFLKELGDPGGKEPGPPRNGARTADKDVDEPTAAETRAWLEAFGAIEELEPPPPPKTPEGGSVIGPAKRPQLDLDDAHLGDFYQDMLNAPLPADEEPRIRRRPSRRQDD